MYRKLSQFIILVLFLFIGSVFYSNPLFSVEENVNVRLSLTIPEASGFGSIVINRVQDDQHISDQNELAFGDFNVVLNNEHVDYCFITEDNLRTSKFSSLVVPRKEAIKTVFNTIWSQSL